MRKDERTLIDRVKHGDTEAMQMLYERYYRPMFNTAYRIVNDFHFAEDVMHEAFLKAFDRIGTFEGRAPFGAWLKRIVVNESLQWLRKYGRFSAARLRPARHGRRRHSAVGRIGSEKSLGSLAPLAG